MDTVLTLHVVNGPLAGGGYRVTAPGSCVIGRSADCDLSLPDTPAARTVSRHHCRIVVEADGATVNDLGSRNGTFVNGRPIGRRPADYGATDWPAEGPGRPLADGDDLRVGDTFFRVKLTIGDGVEVGELVGAAG